MRNILAELPAGPARLDTTIRVNRFVSPIYPSWMWVVMHPDLQNTGPLQYDLRTDVRQWSHDDQKNGKVIFGQAVYDYLRERDELDTCLGLVDGIEIQKNGTAVFDELFGDTDTTFLLRSVIKNRSGSLYAPFFFKIGDRIKMGWYWLGGRWHKNYRALRFN